ncbi:MAG: aspartate--tRNA ligase [Actinomycetota bacterium]|nr:aspartate--tRNA ligase [Actinomycetota bacterium]
MRTHWCGDLRPEHVGLRVRLTGWVHRRRDHGGVIFLDMRDREGIVQVVLHPTEQPEAYRVAEGVRSEYVLKVEGMVQYRLEGAENPNLATGEVEVAAHSVEVLSRAETPPFQIEDRVDVNEELRLKYRYLDLRRPEMQRNLKLRHRTVSAIRQFFDDEGFVEVETPLLNKSTPEGARDYLVPSRLQPGRFFALQQSPQLFKQLLMVAGMDRYYQIVRCFRDEDPRADRQPDFTQLDVEVSFADEEDVIELIEQMFASVMKSALGVDISTPFPQMTYEEAMNTYGSDKPDLRFGLEMFDVTEVFSDTGVDVFRRTIESGGSAKALKVPGGGSFSRKELEGLSSVARNMGAGGMAWVVFEKEGVSSPISKAMSTKEVDGLLQSASASEGDLVVIVCDRPRVAQRSLGEVRLALRDKLNLVPHVTPDDPNAWRFVWILETPLVEYNETESRWDPTHHPFTAPRPEDLPLLEEDPGAVRSRAYDVVLNGWEVGGGSIRIHRPELQRRVFDLVGINEEQADRKFGWFVDAFKYGAPPHGGIAVGIDRLVALLGGKESIREVMAFPKSSAMTDLMTGAPDVVDESQLSELHISVNPPKAP